MKETLIIIGVIFLIAIIWIVSFSIKTCSNLIDKTVNANSIISNYEWFYDMKGQIDATRNKYQTAKKNNMQEVNGIKMVLDSMIAEYNSKSKQITRNLWKANDLPYQINFNEEEE